MSEAGEFQIIEQFFTYPSFGAWKSQGVGDDCAIIDTGAGRLAVTCDMTALGTHFFPDADPEDVGYKALAVSRSASLFPVHRPAASRRRMAGRFLPRSDGACT